MCSNFNAVGRDSIVYELVDCQLAVEYLSFPSIYLIIFRGELVQTLLDNMIAIQILDQNYDVLA